MGTGKGQAKRIKTTAIVEKALLKPVALKSFTDAETYEMNVIHKSTNALDVFTKLDQNNKPLHMIEFEGLRYARSGLSWEPYSGLPYTPLVIRHSPRNPKQIEAWIGNWGITGAYSIKLDDFRKGLQETYDKSVSSNVPVSTFVKCRYIDESPTSKDRGQRHKFEITANEKNNEFNFGHNYRSEEFDSLDLQENINPESIKSLLDFINNLPEYENKIVSDPGSLIESNYEEQSGMHF